MDKNRGEHHSKKGVATQMASVSKGAAGEVLAARFLREKGYDILTTNYRCRFGEIDIIAVKKPYIAFVEVKTRNENALYTPREAVTLSKQKRLIQTARLYQQQHPTKHQPRFDVIEVRTSLQSPMTALELEHIQNAYETGDLRAAF